MSEHDKPDRHTFRPQYGQERSADVEFEVGPEGCQTWRLTAHRNVLVASSQVMRAQLLGPLAQQQRRGSTQQPIRVTDVDPRAFQCLLRYLYGHAPQLQTVPTALATLYAAYKYLCPELEWECAAFLNEQMQRRPDYVLDILLTAAFYCSQQRNAEPSAPPAEEVDSDSEGSRLVQCHVPRHHVHGPSTVIGEACRRLLHNCLQVIDQNADLVLALEQVEDLDVETFLSITSRDSLNVSNETLVLRAAERWAECECKRIKLPHSTKNLRQALGGPHIVCGGRLARLLLLSPQQFAEGPAKSSLLTGDEQKSILIHLVGSPADTSTPRSPSHVAWGLLSTPRKPQAPEYLPIPSSQPQSPQLERSSPARRRRWGFRWPKSKRKQIDQEKKCIQEKEDERPSCCNKACVLFLTGLACLFD